MQGILEGFRVDFYPLCLDIQADMKLGEVGFPSFWVIFSLIGVWNF